MSKVQVSLTIEIDVMSKLFGALDENVKALQKRASVKILTANGELKIIGESENAELAKRTINRLIQRIVSGEEVTPSVVERYVDMIVGGDEETIDTVEGEVVAYTAKGKPIKCKTSGQRAYVKAIKSNTITFGIGPAGTGKTYLAVAKAVTSFKAGEVSRIILTRPAIEAGEKLGFLPGDLQEKVDPYLRPLYDALSDMLGAESYVKLIERGILEIAPLAYMRGRTLSDAFIILDEAQNTTNEQMKMFLTRLGEGSKMVITGDLTQIDLPDGKKSGLKQAANILEGIDGIKIMYLTDKDIVRCQLVGKIVSAYEKGETNER